MLVGDLIDQEPVGFDVALADILPFDLERMVAPQGRERLIVPQEGDDRVEFREVVATLGDALQVFAEGRLRPESFHTLR